MVTGLSSIAVASDEVVHAFEVTLQSSTATAGHVAVVARLASAAACVEHAC